MCCKNNTSYGTEPPLLAQRCNSATAGLGYLEVNVICPFHAYLPIRRLTIESALSVPIAWGEWHNSSADFLTLLTTTSMQLQNQQASRPPHVHTTMQPPSKIIVFKMYSFQYQSVKQNKKLKKIGIDHQIVKNNDVMSTCPHPWSASPWRVATLPPHCSPSYTRYCRQRWAIFREVVSGEQFPGKLSAVRHFPEFSQRCAIFREVVSGAPFIGRLPAVRHFPESCQQFAISRKAVSGATFPGKLSAVRHFPGSCQRCAISREVVSSAPLPGKLSAVRHFPGGCQQCAIFREAVSDAPFSLSAVRHFLGGCQRCAIFWEGVSGAPFPGRLSAVRHFPGSCQRCAISWEVVSDAPFPGRLSALRLSIIWSAVRRSAVSFPR